MPIYEQRLQKDLDKLQEMVATVAERVDTALNNAALALLNHDETLANRTILGDQLVNRELRRIDIACHNFIARHLPSAGHLRYVSAILRLLFDLERIGDYAVTISREVLQLSGKPEGAIRRDLESMFDHSRTLFRQATKAFNEKNPELARGTMAVADQVEGDLDTAFKDLVTSGAEGVGGTAHLLELYSIFYMLERVANRAKNICEETLFHVTGEIKGEKVWNILFIDETNSVHGQMAEAIARRAFPASGRYSSAGRTPATAISEHVTSFMLRNGLSSQGLQPKGLENLALELHATNIIISLQGAVRSYPVALPFHTSFLEWQLPEVDATASATELNNQLLEVYRSISLNLRELMESLRGEEAI